MPKETNTDHVTIHFIKDTNNMKWANSNTNIVAQDSHKSQIQVLLSLNIRKLFKGKGQNQRAKNTIEDLTMHRTRLVLAIRQLLNGNKTIRGNISTLGAKNTQKSTKVFCLVYQGK